MPDKLQNSMNYIAKNIIIFIAGFGLIYLLVIPYQGKTLHQVMIEDH